MNNKKLIDEEIVELYKQTLDDIYYNHMYYKYIKLVTHMIKKLEMINKDDIVQEAAMKLHECMLTYNSARNTSFITFYICSFKRLLSLLSQDDYYIFDPDCQNSKDLPDHFDQNSYFEIMYMTIMDFKDEYPDVFIIEEIVKKNSTLRDIAREYNINYNCLYRRYTTLLNNIKKALTKNEI